MTMTSENVVDYAEHLRSIATGCRLSKERFGITKALDDTQKAQAASAFGADAKRISASKKLLDTKNPRVKAVSSVLSRATSLWKERTLPYPEAGIRLLRTGDISEFDRKISSLQSELSGAAALLQQCWPEIRDAAYEALRDLWRSDDYPDSIEDKFRISVDYPSISPDERLLSIDADLYARQSAVVKARFQESVHMAEQQFAAELRKLISHIVETCQGLNDGTKKQFSPSNLDGLNAFVERFRELNIGSSAELDGLVDDARSAVAGYQPEWFEASQDIRQVVRDRFSEIRDELDTMIVPRPKRQISFED